jgi:endonuclease/exonuclease/phosphatase family metal-dependent hydrolase
LYISRVVTDRHFSIRMMTRLLFVALFIQVFGVTTARGSQDTISVMVYNLLYYGVNTSFCTANNNNVELKDNYLRTIISHTLPDIFAVNEMGSGQQNADRILTQVMNSENRDMYGRATYTNTTNSTIVNMLFFRHDKFVLYHEAIVSDVSRDINLYTLYHKSPDLERGDTTFLTCMVAHFKAGSSNGDQQTRLLEAQAIMGYLSQNQFGGNLLLMGDFNMKSSYESAYGLLTYHPNEAIRFYDPVNKPGVWIDNPDMSMFHTQSTRTAGPGCFASGGMDDRFDQILVSESVLSGIRGVRYVEDSYRAIGQDGQRLNQSLMEPPNTSEPEEVIRALYNMSDHLPVMMQVVAGDVSQDLARVQAYRAPSLTNLVNPVDQSLQFRLQLNPGPVYIRLFSLGGELIFGTEQEVSTYGQAFRIDLSKVPGGSYILYISQGNRVVASERIIKATP